MSVDLGALYRSSRQRITAQLQGASAEIAQRRCPATPAWTVHDVIAHLRGITGDARTGNMEGVTTDPWTAAQVERHRDDPLDLLLRDWAVDAEPFEAFLSGPHGSAGARAVIDVHTHEIDIRSALGPCDPLPAEFAEWALPMVAGGRLATIAAAGLPPLRIVTAEGDVIGEQDAPVTMRTSRFELFRAVLGRRSPAQLAGFDWNGADPTPYLAHLFVFSPRAEPLVEA